MVSKNRLDYCIINSVLSCRIIPYVEIYKLKKPVKGIITALILIFAFTGIVSPDKLEQITLKADTGQTYAINQKISIEATTTPGDYELSSSDFKCSGGKITANNRNISFIALFLQRFVSRILFSVI